MMDKWLIRFLMGRRELANKMAEFLRAKLDSVYTFEQRAGEVVVGFGPEVSRVPTRDDAWKLALFVKNQSGLKPIFVIEEMDEQGRMVWVSNCSMCREKDKGPHYEHTLGVK